MRDVLLKAEKWTKNRYIARAEFPNFVTHYRVTFSTCRVESEKIFMNLLDIFFLFRFKKNEKVLRYYFSN